MTESKPKTFELREAGQSPWLDYISRDLLKSGKLRSFIEEYGLLGVTSNPTIFHHAISDPKGGYASDVGKLVRRRCGTLEIYDALTIADIREACDLFRVVYDASSGEHGFVSLEVRPDFARDEERTVCEARRIFRTVARPNLMVKVPATSEGLAAIRRLIGEGININATLIFSARQYRDVHEAYLEGLSDLNKKGGDLSRVHSVASVFVSRHDTKIDKALAALEAGESDEREKTDLRSLRGKAAVANARAIHRVFCEIVSSERFLRLKEQGAWVQKLLWASTSTKNPDYDDLIYVEPLIGMDTVNTMPLATLEAFLDHGSVRKQAVEEGAEEVEKTIARFEEWGLDFSEVGEELQRAGLKAFGDSFDALMKSIEIMREGSAKKNTLPRIKFTLSGVKGYKALVADAKKNRFHKRFFQKDPTLWKDDEEHKKVILNRLGWLSIADEMLGKLYELDELAAEVRREKIKDVVLLGMGGSSLASEVMGRICERPGSPRFAILDTTDPESILKLETKILLKSTLFLVSSKSGSTVETMSQYQYFHDKYLKVYRRSEKREFLAGRHFIAITDEGSRLEKEAYQRHFRRVFINPSDIGGRYSALSFFGMVPAALMGISVRSLLRSARELYLAVEKERDPARNLSFSLGLLIGYLAKEGKNKLTLWPSRSLRAFGAWLEQLVAESTGKEGVGVVPVDREEPGQTVSYGRDRVFVVFRLQSDKDVNLRSRIQAVKRAGFPVIEVEWPKRSTIGSEFLNWEIVTAVMGMVLGIDPFDEPNVKESKDNTTRLLTEAEREGAVARSGLQVSCRSAIDFGNFFRRLESPDYVAVLAYAERSEKMYAALGKFQRKIREFFKVPVLVGFGPRYLHSIGQLYKGGPDEGRFIVLVTRDVRDAKIPHARFTFSDLKQAQALGDIQALQDREKPLRVVDLGKDSLGGLRALDQGLARYLNAKNAS